jgi:phage-related protein
MGSRAAELAIKLTEQGASEAANGLDRVGSAASGMGDKVEAAGRSAEKGARGIDTTAEASDELASKGSQAAGAMSGLGDLIGGPFGAAMQTGGIALQAAADSGDLLNAALENSIVASVRSKAATVSKTVADKASAVATKGLTIAQKALNVAQRASPLGLIITGITILAGLLFLAYKRSDTFRRIVDKAMSVAKAGVAKVVDAFQALGPIVGKVASFIGKVVTTYVGVYVKAFQLSLAVVRTVWGAIRDVVANVVDAIKGKADTFRDKFTGALRTIRQVGVDAFNALTAPVQALIDLVEGLLDKIRSIHIPHVDINPFNNKGAGAGAGAGTTTSSSSSSATVQNVTTFNITLTGTASPSDADAFMRTVDQRLRSLGKAPVFSL